MSKDMTENGKIKIAYILSCFPDDTPTFISNEIVELSRLGLDITIFSIHKSVSNNNLPGHKHLLSKTIYAYPPISVAIILSHLYYLFRQPSVYFKLLLNYKCHGGKKAFWEGVYFSRIIIQSGIKHVHAHFAWKATDVARLISSLINIPFSFSSHARDIYVKVDHFKDKLKESKFVITCVKQNKKAIIDRYGDELKDKIHVVYHGVDIDKFAQESQQIPSRIDILSVGRLVEKKGFKYLIEAISLLKRKGINIKCKIVGEGNEHGDLKSIISKLHLKDDVKLINFVKQDELLKFYSCSKMFILPCIIAKDGDRDGIPNVLMEAMAMELPVVTTNVPHMHELIEHRKDGIQVRERDHKALAKAIGKLLGDERLRGELGKNARAKIVRQFNSRNHIKDLARIFKSTV